MPGDTILSANGATFTQNNCIVDSFTDLYANNIYYKTINGTAGATNYGYSSGGTDQAPPATPTPAFYNSIQRFPFALAITNTTSVGTLSSALRGVNGTSSPTYGYNSAGYTGSASTSNIQRWPFALAITNTTSVGNLVADGRTAASCQSSTYGYRSMGVTGLPPGTPVSSIDRFPFALAITNATSVGTVSQYSNYYQVPGTQSPSSGYIPGTTTTAPPAPFTVLVGISSFPFALAITNTTNTGTLARPAWQHGAAFSTDYGYSIGGYGPPAFSTQVSNFERFPFALAITSGVAVGNLTQSKGVHGGTTSSSTYGHTQGGGGPGIFGSFTRIERFPFALAITNSATVGNLSATVFQNAGTQY